eukprot:COSAG01_NODE_2970_length_6775_cov_8.832235_7_plen_53_part_00
MGRAGRGRGLRRRHESQHQLLRRPRVHQYARPLIRAMSTLVNNVLAEISLRF